MHISKHNLTILKKYFNWHDVDVIDKETICELADHLGVHHNPDEIEYEKSWFEFNSITVSDKKGNKLFYIKRIWEAGSVKELLGMELGRLFDPDICLGNYVIGRYKTKILKRKIPFFMIPWVPGRPIEKQESLKHPFKMGKQYEFGRWLSLYDCYPKHYLIQSDKDGKKDDEKTQDFGKDKKIKRIDYGLAFYKLRDDYEGFADIWPKELFSHPKFHEGIKNEHQKIRLRFDIVQKRVFKILNQFSYLKLDDFFNFRGTKLKRDILEYWRREGFLDDQYKLRHRYKFLHTAKCEHETQE